MDGSRIFFFLFGLQGLCTVVCVLGKTNVWVYRICIPVDLLQYNLDHRNPRIHFKSVERWLDMADLPIPESADYPCTGSEYLFLHHIPEQFITKKWRY